MANPPRLENFSELRNGLLGMQAFSTACLEFLDEQFGGMAQRRKYNKTNGAAAGGTNGNAVAQSFEALKEKVKRHYTSRRSPSPKRKQAQEPDGNHLTIGEAAQRLGVSDASIRNWIASGKYNLGEATYESRPNPNGAMQQVMVLHKDNVEAAVGQIDVNPKVQAAARQSRSKRGKKKSKK